MAAIRFTIEGSSKLFTSVNGERFTMEPHDLILTPAWTWHDHQNETKEPIVWLDGLDIPLVGFIDASFAQNSNRKEQEVTREKETSQAMYGANLLPIDDVPISASLQTVEVFADGTGARLKFTEQDAFLDGWDDAGSRQEGTEQLLKQLGEALDG